MNDSIPQLNAIIDLGSNTARMIVMKAIPGYSFRLVDEIREVVRLRQGMTSKGLSPDAEVRAISTLRLFKRFCDSTQVDRILPVATSAVRDASNGVVFIERVNLEVGLEIKILSGELEAFYGAVGALNEVPIDKGYIVDIGGGSAQISEIRSGRFYRGDALPLGALTLTEKFVKNDPVPDHEVQAIRDEITGQLATLSWVKKRNDCQLVGLGGTIRNLAKIEASRRKYPLYTLHGFNLSRESVENSIRQFLDLPLTKRKEIEGLKNDRADIILPGAMVILEIMKLLDKDSLTLSMSGLREGLFFEHFWEHLPYPVIPDVRRFSVLNMARNYQYQKIHANHVRYLSGRLFDQLAPLHGYEQPERQLLEAAALLHDIGTVVGYDGHHRHSQTLIEVNGLSGFTPREIALIGLLARYHRKGNPDIQAYKSITKTTDQKLLKVLSAILRLAEFLERGRTATIDDVILTWDEKSLRLTLIADDYPIVELWQAEQNALPLVGEVFGRQAFLDSVAAPNRSGG